MGLNERYEAGFIAQVEAAMRGEVSFIPAPLDRVGKVFNLMQSRYTLISGATGSGKTSFTDYTYILRPHDYVKTSSEDIHWEVLYFSLERKAMFKHAKWISWMIYRDHGRIVSADELMGWGANPISDAGYKLIRSYDAEMSTLLEHVQIYDGKIGADVVSRAIKRRALDLGTLYYSDSFGVYKQASPVPIHLFTDDNLIEQTKTGPKRYIVCNHEGMSFKLYEDDRRYFLKNPKTFVYIVIDGINLLGNKEEIDDISMEISNARDVYGFSPVVVTQQNRAMGDIQRMKLHGGDLSPQLEDIFKSSQMGFDADLVLGLFDPYRYKAYDSEGKYEGYCLKPDSDSVNSPSLLAPSGHCRFRSLHVMKNTFGPDGNKFGMKFLGECNHFEVLPFPDDILMQKIYAEVRQGI